MGFREYSPVMTSYIERHLFRLTDVAYQIWNQFFITRLRAESCNRIVGNLKRFAVSRDINLQNKAEFAGIPCVEPPSPVAVPLKS